MKIIVNDVDGYLGNKISLYLLQKGCEIIGLVYDKNNVEICHNYLTVIEKDQLSTIKKNEQKADAAIFLIPRDNNNDINCSNTGSAIDFRILSEKHSIDHLICLTTILDGDTISTTTKEIKIELKKGNFACTFLKADFIIASGSPTFELIRKSIENFPVLILPYWTKAICYPSGITDVLEQISVICGNEKYFNKTFTIGCKTPVSPKVMYSVYSRIRGVIRLFISIPFSLAKPSGFFLRLFTKLPSNKTKTIIEELKIRYTKRELQDAPDIILNNDFSGSLKLALGIINPIRKSKKTQESLSIKEDHYAFEGHKAAPYYGCYHMTISKIVYKKNTTSFLENIISTGENNQMHLINWFWHFKGWTNWVIKASVDKEKPGYLSRGDKIDFWEVKIADYENSHFLFYADLLLPGEGWLEFKINPGAKENIFIQTLVFRPLGYTGRFYWFWAKPLHYLLMKKVAGKLLTK